MDKKDTLITEIKLLESLEYSHAYRGSLDDLKQISVVEYSKILDLLNQKRKELKDEK